MKENKLCPPLRNQNLQMPAVGSYPSLYPFPHLLARHEPQLWQTAVTVLTGEQPFSQKSTLVLQSAWILTRQARLLPSLPQIMDVLRFWDSAVENIYKSWHYPKMNLYVPHTWPLCVHSESHLLTWVTKTSPSGFALVSGAWLARQQKQGPGS